MRVLFRHKQIGSYVDGIGPLSQADWTPKTPYPTRHTTQTDEALTNLAALSLLSVCKVIAQGRYCAGQGEGEVHSERVAVDGRDQQREELLRVRWYPW